MNIRTLIEKFSANLVAKVVCLSLAIVIYIFHQVSLLDKKSLTVPLKVQSEGVLINTTNVPSYVKVSVRTKFENLSSINSSKVHAFLDLNQFTETGSYTVPVRLELSEDLMLMDPVEVQVHPENIKVELDEKIVRYVPVEPVFSGEVEHGYVITKTEIIPSTVKVEGPEHILKAVKRINTGKVNIKGAATGFSSDVNLDNINTLIKPFPEGTFKVNISIEPSVDEFPYSKNRIDVENLDSMLVIDTKLPEISFKLKGMTLDLEKFSVVPETISIDLSDITVPGEYEIPVKVSVPENLEVSYVSEEKVKVKISEKIVIPEENAEEKTETEAISDENTVQEENPEKAKQ